MPETFAEVPETAAAFEGFGVVRAQGRWRPVPAGAPGGEEITL